MGAFCVTTGFGVEDKAKAFEESPLRLQFHHG